VSAAGYRALVAVAAWRCLLLVAVRWWLWLLGGVCCWWPCAGGRGCSAVAGLWLLLSVAGLWSAVATGCYCALLAVAGLWAVSLVDVFVGVLWSAELFLRRCR
jgi:hypothetical protein